MFFSARQYYQHLNSDAGRDAKSQASRFLGTYIAPTFNGRTGMYTHATQPKITFKETSKLIGRIKQAIVDRQNSIDSRYGSLYLNKWLRPWHVVPKLKTFTPPEGDFGIGVEIEMGFRSLTAARTVAAHIKNWHNVALDYEACEHPIEATFPPFLYSKMGPSTQCVRYLKFLEANSSLVHRHAEYTQIGTHVNVSYGYGRQVSNSPNTYGRMGEVNRILADLSGTAKGKYFGRNPYGYGYSRNTYIEWKLFNSQTDSRRLRQYIDIAVELTRLVHSDTRITGTTVLAALETGYNKLGVVRKAKAKKIASPPVRLAA